MEETMPLSELPSPAPGEAHLVVAALADSDRATLAAAIELAASALGAAVVEHAGLAAAIDDVTSARRRGAFPAVLVGSRAGDEEVRRAARALAGACGTAPLVRWTVQTSEETLTELLAAGCCDVIGPRRGAADDLVRSLRLALEVSRRRAAEARLARRRDEGEVSPELATEARRFAGAGRLLVSVSHDLNNLLQPATGYLELLADRLPAASEEAGMVAVMQRSTEIAATLVQRLLGIARSGEVASLRLAPDRLLETLDPLVRSAAGVRVRLDVVLGAPGARVSLPAGALEQIILNLVANARDAMPGGGALALRSRRTAGAWELEVVDTGSGIEMAEPARLFESGYTTKERARGTGLGLWIVRSLVEEAGGEVEIGNAPGGGARVGIRLPLAPADGPRPYHPSR